MEGGAKRDEAKFLVFNEESFHCQLIISTMTLTKKKPVHGFHDWELEEGFAHGGERGPLADGGHPREGGAVLVVLTHLDQLEHVLVGLVHRQRQGAGSDA